MIQQTMGLSCNGSEGSGGPRLTGSHQGHITNARPSCYHALTSKMMMPIKTRTAIATPDPSSASVASVRKANRFLAVYIKCWLGDAIVDVSHGFTDLVT